jgi:ATP-dependent DNA ligase
MASRWSSAARDHRPVVIDEPGDLWLDGEAVVLGTNGQPDFDALQERFRSAQHGEHHSLVRPAMDR